MNIFNKLRVASVVLLTLICSCKKFLEIDPPKDKISESEIFKSDEIATSAVTGIYSRMINTGPASGNQNSIAVICGLSSDEFKSHNVGFNGFFQSNIAPSDPIINNLWSSSYSYIYSCNAIIEGLKSSTQLKQVTRRQLEGEAKFVRAFFYFYLVNLFGEVPLNLASDFRLNEQNSKASTSSIYSQIITDLTDAENLLPESYINNERIRPNKFVAKALLARVYLYRKNWSAAIEKASDVILQNGIYKLVDLDKVFLKNSFETIWQLMPPAGLNTREGALFILTNTPNFISLLPNFINKYDILDLRKQQWIGKLVNSTGEYFFPFKYKIRSSSTVSEYSMVIRLAELYLIRAEAYAQQNNLVASKDDLALIIKRSGVNVPLIGLNQSQTLLEIERQRSLELFAEWGHRWMDLKRTDRANIILESLKGKNWSVTDQLYPIPNSEISTNRNISQNQGY